MAIHDLLEREAELRLLGRLLDQASSGSGRVALVEGEAGVGKTSLVHAFLDTSTAGTEVWVGRCDPLATPRPFAPLHDIAAIVGGRLQHLLRDEAPPFDVFGAMLDGLRAAGPARIVVMEDIHWADGASLDLVRYLGRRLTGLRALLLLTYRADEVQSTHPALVAVGDVSSLPWARRITLGGLSRQAVASLTSGTPLDPDEVHRVTGGNAFYVTEVVAARDTRVPVTVRDAILARAAALSAAGRATLEIASVLGARVEPGLLVALDAMSNADECIARGVLVERDGALLFRHELAREAILGSVLPGRRMRLAAAALAELSRGPVAAADLARLAALAEEAHDSAAALRYAAGAARHAAAVRGGRLVDVACRRLAGANRSSGRRDRRGGGGTVPARAGRHEAAAEEWARIGCPYEEALSLARTGASGRRRALALLDGLGARVTMAVVSRALRASGARALPRGPLRRTRANPFGLTAREVEVCSLLRGPAGGG